MYIIMVSYDCLRLRCNCCGCIRVHVFLFNVCATAAKKEVQLSEEDGATRRAPDVCGRQQRGADGGSKRDPLFFCAVAALASER